MKLKKLLIVMAVTALAVGFSLSALAPVNALAAIVRDELDETTMATLVNLTAPVDSTQDNYYGPGGDTSIRGMQTAGEKYTYGYAEYSVNHVAKVSANFYFCDMNANKPYLEIDSKSSNKWSSWGDPNASLAPSNWDDPGEDIIFKYLDVETTDSEKPF